jgi:hypothetical protein
MLATHRTEFLRATPLLILVTLFLLCRKRGGLEDTFHKRDGFRPDAEPTQV